MIFLSVSSKRFFSKTGLWNFNFETSGFWNFNFTTSGTGHKKTQSTHSQRFILLISRNIFHGFEHTNNKQYRPTNHVLCHLLPNREQIPIILIGITTWSHHEIILSIIATPNGEEFTDYATLTGLVVQYPRVPGIG